MIRRTRTLAAVTAVLLVAALGLAAGQQPPLPPPSAPFEPVVGQPGKDVVWVPTPPALVEKMLDLAAVTPQDVVMDLGSGDGRNIIAAARRGARAIGVEFNADMVAFAERQAREAGVADRASFVQGDMFEADVSKASVLALFLLPDNLTKLRDRFLGMRPGSRIVVNTFGIDGWEPEATEKIEGDCASWCTAMLYIVPARVAGTWTTPQGTLTLNQDAQTVTGVLDAKGRSVPIAKGRVRGEEITLVVGGAEYTGRVAGDRIDGTMATNGSRTRWTAERRR